MPELSVELVTIGTELLLGFTADTNGAHLGQAFSAAGIRVVRRTSVDDRPAEIRSAIDQALSRTGFVVTTGGLGPTRDDLSRQVVADLLEMPLEFDPAVWEAVLARYRRFGRTPVESNRSQAMVPRGGIALPNQWGTAPGLWLESPRGLIVMLPGVPLEMRKLMEHEVLPRLAAGAHGNAIVSAVLRTVGIPESTLAERIGTLEDELAPLTLAYLPSVAGVDLRLTAWTEPATRAEQLLRDAIARLRDVAGDWAYGEDTTDLAGVVIDRLRARGDTIAVAESCTGGMLGERITAVAGASDVFAGGVIAYDNRVKTGLLGVAEALIAEHGAVSGPVAAAMADGVVRVLGVQVAAAITGIAGPRGGSDEKPVGTVWFGFHVEGRTTVHQSVFGGTRTEIRERAAQGALAGLWKALGR